MPKITNAVATAQLDALTVSLNTGFLRFYSGTQPATADTALSGNTLLAELTFAATAFPSATNGVAVANAITQDSSANATGTATFARALASNGTTVVADFTVSTSGADINLVTTSITATQVVQITSFQLTQPKG